MSYYGKTEYCGEVSVLLGKTLLSVEKLNTDDGDSLLFTTTEGERYVLWHCQDCCESVWIEDIAGELGDLVGSPITMADEASNHEENGGEYEESCTWTFYKFATIKGYVNIRWCGSSNGYYSEGVDFARLK